MNGIMDGIIEHNGGFYAQIRINHRDIPLGYWKTFAQAVKALWEREVFDSRVNRPTPTEAEIWLKKRELLSEKDLAWQKKRAQISSAAAQ